MESLFATESSVAVRPWELFHDESGFSAGARYGVHGLLAVPTDRLEPICGELARARRERGYHGELHFKDLGGTRFFESPAWRTANDWMRMFFENFLVDVRFKAFVVDMQHKDFDRVRYPTERHAYRRFAITVAKSLLAWCFRDQNVLLTAWSDRGNPSASWNRRDGNLFKSFDRYVVRECRRARRAKPRYPIVAFASPLRELDSNPNRLSSSAAQNYGLALDALRQRCDLIQLTDLLVGAINASLTLAPTSEGKRQLAQSLAEKLGSTYDLPWHLAVPRARRFSVSVFPGSGRLPYAISLSGVRRCGIARLASDPDLRREYQERFGFRLDRVLEGQRSLGFD